MKILSTVLRSVFALVVIILALAFSAIEVSLLLTLDFTLFENEALALVQLILKLAIALFALVLGLFALIKTKRSFLTESICLLLSSAVMIPFISNGIGIYIDIVAVLFMLTNLFFALTHARNKLGGN